MHLMFPVFMAADMIVFGMIGTGMGFYFERLRTEHKMLREALQPFAEAWLERETWEAQINIDDLRAAHKAYGSCHDWSN